MDMKINASVIVKYRKDKAWSQQHLADVSGLSLRTVQRIENTSAGSPDSIKAIAMAFDLIPADLMEKVEAEDDSHEDNLHQETDSSKGEINGVENQVSCNTIAASLAPKSRPPMLVMGFGMMAILMTGLWLTIGQNGEPLKAAVDPVSITSEADVARQKVAEQAALEWLTLLDNDEYLASWQQSDLLVQEEVTATQWQQSIQQVRVQFGTTISRQLSSIELATSLPGLPDGEYGILIFSTEFANKSDAFETVPMTKSSGEWRSMGYFIR